jgi:hypothetical protein
MSSSPPTNEPDNYVYDMWLLRKWAKEDKEGALRALNASITSEEEENEHVDVDYQGLLERVKALSASVSGVSTTTSPSSSSNRPRNIAVLLDLGEKMLFRCTRSTP